VTDDQIVSGHEYEKGKYVTIEPEELDKLRTPADKMVSIDAFVSPDTIDPIYLSGKVYYLVPEGAVGGHPFNLLREGMVTDNKYAVAKVVMFGKEHIVLLRPAGSLLEMFELDYDFQVKKHTEFADLVPKVDVDPEELDMTKSLIETKTAQKFDQAGYKDTNTEVNSTSCCGVRPLGCSTQSLLACLGHLDEEDGIAGLGPFAGVPIDGLDYASYRRAQLVHLEDFLGFLHV